jgi:hypothetical protein
MKKSLVVAVVVASVLVVGCAEEPAPVHPVVPSPEEVDAARARRIAQRAEQEAAQRELNELADRQERERQERERKEREAAAEREQEIKRVLAAQQTAQPLSQPADRDATARAVIEKLRRWVQAHVSWSFAFPGSVKTTCQNAVNVNVPCDSAAARTRIGDATINAAATVRNDTKVPLRCEASFWFDSGSIKKRTNPQSVKNSSSRFTQSASFWLPTLAYKAQANGECVLTLEDIAKIVDMPVDDLKAMYPSQPREGERYGVSFWLSDTDGHTEPMAFSTVYLPSEDSNFLFTSRVKNYR